MCAYHQFNFNLISLCRTSPLKELSLYQVIRGSLNLQGASHNIFFSIGTKMYAIAKIN